MKRVLFSVLPLFFVILVIISGNGCKKDGATITNNVINDTCIDDNIYPVAGLWTGTYTGDGSTEPPAFYSLAIYSDGSILVKAKVPSGYTYSRGTWTLTGNQFSADITQFDNTALPVVQEINATFSNTGTMTNATWHDVSNPNCGGGCPLNTGDFQNLNRIN